MLSVSCIQTALVTTVFQSHSNLKPWASHLPSRCALCLLSAMRKWEKAVQLTDKKGAHKYAWAHPALASWNPWYLLCLLHLSITHSKFPPGLATSCVCRSSRVLKFTQWSPKLNFELSLWHVVFFKTDILSLYCIHRISLKIWNGIC